MLSEEEIHQWWNRKIKTYIKNYTRRNKLTLLQANAKFLTETHDKFLESTLDKSKDSLTIVHNQT